MYGKLFQHCIQELKCLKQERVSEHIEDALRCLREDIVPCADQLVKLTQVLGLTSNQELLKESMAVEKERINAQASRSKGDLDEKNQIVDLVSYIRDCMLKMEAFDAKSSILIPPYFRCPLSLELMLDPVILASGQTYDRASIQKWLDHGLTICPKTHQVLAHTNLIPNYTVKAMIANWCEENNMHLSTSSECDNSVPDSSLSNGVSSHHFVHTDSFRCSLPRSSSGSRSSSEAANGFEKLKVDALIRLDGEYNESRSKDIEKNDCSSPEQSYTHSRSESASSAMSCIEYVHSMSNEASRMPKKHENVSELSVEIISRCSAASPSNKELGFSPLLSEKQFHTSKTKLDVASNGHHDNKGAKSFTFAKSRSDDLTTNSHVKKLVEDLMSQSNEAQTTAAAELRLLAKHNMENRIIIGQSGAIAPLLSLLYSEVKLTQEHAVTALLNLSINDDNKAMIAEAGAIEPLIHVLKSGNDGAKENSAAALFSLSVLEEYKAKIGRSGAVKALVHLLGRGTLRGKKDAVTALFNLSIFHENKARIVQAGAVKYLMDLMDSATGMVDKAVALLTNLSTIEEGRLAIVREGGIPLLVEVIESGSQRGKENSASILLQLCVNSPKFCTLVLQEGAVPPLVALSQSGTPRAKEKVGY